MHRRIPVALIVLALGWFILANTGSAMALSDIAAPRPGPDPGPPSTPEVPDQVRDAITRRSAPLPIVCP